MLGSNPNTTIKYRARLLQTSFVRNCSRRSLFDNSIACSLSLTRSNSMATETQKPKEIDLQHHDELSSKTLEKSAPAPLESRLEESSTQSSSLEPSSAEDPTTLEEGEGKKIESPNAEAPTTGPPSDLEKKMRRAERFGMPMHLSEVEKRNSRAERFGTGTASHVSDELKKSEELKRKARAERFGLQAQTTDDEEAKKKARSARFASVLKTDPAEEEKKKSRAIRFSQTASGAQSQVNGNAKSEQKTTIVTEASGGA